MRLAALNKQVTDFTRIPEAVTQKSKAVCNKHVVLFILYRVCKRFSSHETPIRFLRKPVNQESIKMELSEFQVNV